MFETISQPNATPLSQERLQELLQALHSELGGAQPVALRFRDQHSNDVTEVQFSDGRTLMVKQGRYDWVAQRFRTSRWTAGVLRDEAGVLAPRPVALTPALEEAPLEAYWRIELPTLEELWPDLPEASRPPVFWSWGALLRRMHRVNLPGYGAISGYDAPRGSLVAHLEGDLANRLKPAVEWEWPEGVPLLDALLGLLPEISHRSEKVPATLVHNDMHMGNILCEQTSEGVSCVGLLDLEAAFAGPAEADLANLEIMHGPLFGRPLPGPWLLWVREGYGGSLDERMLGFFRAYNLVNQGFYSAMVGHREHAAAVGAEARRELDALLGSECPIPPVH